MNKILDIDRRIETASCYMKLGQPLETAYPKLHKSSFSYSNSDLIQAVNWMWLQVHNGKTYQEVTRSVSEIAKRSLAFYGALQGGRVNRDRHDYLLLNVAILAGDQELMREVLCCVSVADVNADQPNYWRALTGILKFMLDGDRPQAERQFEILCLCKGKEAPIRAAKKNVLKSFIAGDVKAIQRQIKSVTEYFWKRLEQATGAEVQSREGDIKLGLWDHNRFWPWPEAGILKLMYQRGIEFKTNEFWLPAKLISGKD